MKVTIENDYEGMSRHAARHVIAVVKQKPSALVCIAAGDTPKLMCKFIAEAAHAENIDLSSCFFVSLDEWVGIRPENEGSCQYFLRNNLFTPLNISEEQIHLFNSLATDLQNECKQMDEFIRSHGGIDIIVVGVGRNGHIGFNEPDIPFEKYSHVVDLDETTQSVGQKYFKEQTVLSKGITLGLQHLLESRKAILIANGEKKAVVVKEALEGQIGCHMPASVMRKHTDGEMIIDKEAASKLTSTHKNN